MSTLRFCAIAVFALMATATYADTMMYSGAADACGTMPGAAAMFGNSSTTCTKANACQATYCTCIGAAAPTSFTCGAFSGSMPNCSVTSACVAAKIACINAAADDASSGCSALKDLKMSNLGVAGGQLYNASMGYKACKYEACKMVNATAMGGNCSLNFATLCASPVKFTASLVLRGNWAVFLSSPTKKAALKAALEADLTKKLGFTCIVIKMSIKTNRRRAGESNLLIEFQATGVSGNNAALKANLAAAQNDKSGSFLSATLAAYQTENAGQSFSVKGLSAGSASSAVFSYTNSASSATSGTTGTTTGTTSGSSGTTTGTTTGGSGSTGTTTGTTTGSSSASGAATQSLMAAVVVAVLGAMLF